MKKGSKVTPLLTVITIILSIIFMSSCSNDISVYAVSFDSQGGSYVAPMEAIEGSKIVEPIPPSKLGFSFGGWYSDLDFEFRWDFSLNTVESNMTLYAKWAADSYPVTYEANGATSGSVPDAQTKIHGVDFAVASNSGSLVRVGYSFVGWNTQADGSGTDYAEDATYTSDAALTLYAKWMLTHKVTFNSQGGTYISPIEKVFHGTKIVEPVIPEKDGYIFIGWYKDSLSEVPWDFDTSVVDSNITLYAKWIIANYLVLFDSRGGSDVPSIHNVVHGTKISEPVSPTKLNHVFDGWFTDVSCTTQWYFSTDSVNANLTLYAKWIEPHKVEFNSQGGNLIPEVSDVMHGDVLVKPIDPSRSGHIFGGWFRESSCINKWEFSKDTVTTNMTLYADWITLYLVSFDSKGGSPIHAIEVGNGGKISSPTIPEKVGYTFQGWYKEVACINQWDFNTDLVNTSMTLYAKWSVNSYSVSFESQSGSIPAPGFIDVVYYQTYGALPTVSRIGYTFDGWWTDVDGTGEQVLSSTTVSITEDQTLYAKWLANQYNVTFDERGGDELSPANLSVVYGTEYGTLPTPERRGYTFDGWWTDVDGTGDQVLSSTTVSITEDQTLYAKWVVNSYRVNFNSNGGSDPDPNYIEVVYGQTYGVLPAIIKTGYEFSGWLASIDGIVTRIYSSSFVSIPFNHTLSAKWTAANYTVTFDNEDGSIPSQTSIRVTYNQPYGTLPTAQKEGYIFEGWFTNTGGNGTKITRSTIVSITNNQVLYARWRIPVVGGIGQAGGYIFYDKGAYSDGWRYLEAAPAGWAGSSSDPRYIFGYHREGFNEPNLTVRTEEGIGTGEENTRALAALMPYSAYINKNSAITEKTTEFAINICDDNSEYVDGFRYVDWFLPSIGELELMYNVLYLNNLGGFSPSPYWSSTVFWPEIASEWSFYGGSSGRSERNIEWQVRPIRAF